MKDKFFGDKKTEKSLDYSQISSTVSDSGNLKIIQILINRYHQQYKPQLNTKQVQILMRKMLKKQNAAHMNWTCPVKISLKEAQS